MKMLSFFCLTVIGAFVLWPAVAYLPLDPMPGDLALNVANLRVYIPATTCLSASVILTLFFWYMRK